ncbi:hypothetical protein O181_105630 [Austropuccinia psidii MF-1]|uniref:Uncharacterized protein n=1 Tax=Austropuccinia psidii MF-1 TaxID=1389203 RepID=A0A9Q3JQV5_9BASI|nr:hypothetical protein [Austropuccinia psidii MF-1]
MVLDRQQIAKALHVSSKWAHNIGNQELKGVMFWNISSRPCKPMSALCSGTHLTVKRLPTFCVKVRYMLLQKRDDQGTHATHGGDTAADLLVPSSAETSSHQQLLLKVVVTRKPQKNSDSSKSSKTGTTPAVHKWPTDKMVPEILSENTTSCTRTKPLLMGSLRVVICDMRMEELELAKKMQKGETLCMQVARGMAPER